MPYKRVRRLGHGHFGEVWLEYDAGLGRYCAAKYFDPAVLATSPFAEAQAMLGAEHDNVVRVYSADLENAAPVIRMEYLPAGSVADQYAGAATPVGEALRIVEDACRGVETLHARGVLHRDLKPANLLLDGDRKVKVSDFGLACKLADVADAPPWGYVEHLPPESVACGGIDTTIGEDFPSPVLMSSGGRCQFWLRAEVEAWHARRRRARQ